MRRGALRARVGGRCANALQVAVRAAAGYTEVRAAQAGLRERRTDRGDMADGRKRLSIFGDKLLSFSRRCEACRVKMDEVRVLHARRVAGEQVPYTRSEADALVAYCLSTLRRKKPGLTSGKIGRKTGPRRVRPRNRHEEYLGREGTEKRANDVMASQ